MKLAVVTFVRNEERVSETFYKFFIKASEQFEVTRIVISEGPYEQGEQISLAEVIEVAPTTKYEKLRFVLPQIDCDYVLCVDADLTLVAASALEVVSNAIAQGIDLAWARISTNELHNTVSRLVFLDKQLSHNLIRPALWGLRVGVSIPGQFFLFRKSTMNGAFSFEDTYLDDLAVGMYARCQSHIKTRGYRSIVGYEDPSTSWPELLRQRARWAHGYRSLVAQAKGSPYLRHLLIHGIAYHFLWVIGVAILWMLLRVNILICVVPISIFSIFLCSGKVRLLPHALIYQLAFPVLHVWWMVNVFK